MIIIMSMKKMKYLARFGKLYEVIDGLARENHNYATNFARQETLVYFPPNYTEATVRRCQLPSIVSLDGWQRWNERTTSNHTLYTLHSSQERREDNECASFMFESIDRCRENMTGLILVTDFCKQLSKVLRYGK